MLFGVSLNCFVLTVFDLFLKNRTLVNLFGGLLGGLLGVKKVFGRWIFKVFCLGRLMVLKCYLKFFFGCSILFRRSLVLRFFSF